MFHPKVDGLWLRAIGGFSPVTVTHTWPHGFDSATWEMDPRFHHPSLRANAPVTIYDGGVPIGFGRLQEPGENGEMVVNGLWQQTRHSPCLTAAGGFTTTPNSAIDGAISRGDVTFTRPASISSTGWITTANGELTLEQLLDGYTAEAGMRWGVDNYGRVEVKADPTAPMWHVPHAVAGRGLQPAEDEFYTHITGRFITSYGTSGPVYDVRTVGSDDAADYFGRRGVQVELEDLGVITAAKAISIITGIFLRSGARMGWSEGLDLTYGQIVTPGGVPAPLNQVQAGQMVRLAGVVDGSRAYTLGMSQDVVLGRSTYTDGSDRISLSIVDQAPRNLADVLKVAVE
ncbi:hypothetical protein [Nocardioides sp. YIM 152315]|uniref:hypothetical protein n=1 Tax=Nocardioides sp. YIM 152315 TaxID=3031760 RepID=UPI0023DCE466|nr:hypothetical protein [Nocardioides sp. YIM 152315]MDF1603405.1 hypothetical protein [Nocardioides sp. YIM 152315]